jgi:hypothetical protein
MLFVTRDFVTSYLLIHRKERYFYSKKVDIHTKLQVIGFSELILTSAYEFTDAATG